MEVDDGNYVGGNAVKSLSEAPGGPMRHGSTSSFSENDYDSYWKVQEKNDAKLAKALAKDKANKRVEMPSPKDTNVPQPTEEAADTAGDQGHHEPAEETPKPSAETSPGVTPAVPAATPCPAAATPADTAGSESEGEDAMSSKGAKVKGNKFDKYYYKSIGGIYIYIYIHEQTSHSVSIVIRQPTSGCGDIVNHRMGLHRKLARKFSSFGSPVRLDVPCLMRYFAYCWNLPALKNVYC